MPDAPFPDAMMPCIEKFLAEVHPTLEPGRDIYPEVFSTEAFFPLQRQAELAAMIRECRTDFGWVKATGAQRIDPTSPGPRVVMEIGADKGGGLYHWCQCLPTVKGVIGCEIRGTPYNRAFERAFPGIDFCWLPHPSQLSSSVSQVREFLGDSRIDVLFIDGDKGRFLEDFLLYRPFMSPRGIVFMHDVNDAGPMMDAHRRAGEMGYRTKRIVDISDAELALGRERADIPPASSHEGWLRHWRGRSCGVGVIYLEGGPR